IYDRLSQKVWMSHGTRGDFVDYRGKKRYAHSGNWCFTIYESGALPYFEKPEQFSAALLQFISET
ncbi:MAG: alpha/beta hydrolase, partial [Pseudomonadota bacterium]